MSNEGRLDTLPAQLQHLVNVDRTGGPIPRGTRSNEVDTALHALVRLLSATNQPMECSLDIIVTTVDVNLGNLAVGVQDPRLGAPLMARK